MNNFIYAFNLDSKNTLIEAGYCLLKGDDINNIYVFINEDLLDLKFANNDGLKFMYSNILTF